jgi:hypothetical protein
MAHSFKIVRTTFLSLVLTRTLKFCFLFLPVNGANHAINANFAVFNSRLSANTTFPWNSNSTLSPTKLVERFTTVSFFVGPEPVTPSDAAINNIVLIASWSIDIRIALVEPSTLTRNQPTNVSLWVIDRNLGANCDQLSLTNQIGAFDLSLDGVAAQVELTEAVPQTQWSLLLRTMVTPAQSSVACRINATITPTSNLQLIAFGLDFKSGFQLASSPVTLIGAAPPTTPSTTSTTTTTTTSTTEMSTEPTTSSEIVTESETTTPTDTTTTESSSDAIDVESPSNGAAIGGIIGGVVGGILLLVCLGVAIFCILRRSNGGEQIQTSSLEAAPEARNSDTFVAAPTSAVAIPPPLTDRPVVVDAPMPVFVNNAAPPPPLPTVGTVTPARIVATPPPPPPPPQPKGSKSPRGGGPTNVQYTGLPNNQQGDAFQHGL